MNSNVQQIQSGIKESYYAIHNLKQNRTYAIALRARNVVGYSESSNTTVSTLKAGKILFRGPVSELISMDLSTLSHNFIQSINQSIDRWMDRLFNQLIAFLHLS